MLKTLKRLTDNVEKLCTICICKLNKVKESCPQGFVPRNRPRTLRGLKIEYFLTMIVPFF